LVFVAALPLAALGQRSTITLAETGTPIVVSLAGGTGDAFRTIEIQEANRKFEFKPRNPVLRVPTSPEARRQDGIVVDIPGLTLDRSRCFLRAEYSENSRRHTFLFFISDAGASDAAPIFVIGFASNSAPYRVLELDQFDVTRFESNVDGDVRIIGKPTLSQVMDGSGYNGSLEPYATTYDPFAVYIVSAKKVAEYSLDASREYNEQHYVWAGPHSREDYAVLYNVPGHTKPFGASAVRAHAILDTKRGRSQ
jgi:hypothetical protein